MFNNNTEASLSKKKAQLASILPLSSKRLSSPGVSLKPRHRADDSQNTARAQAAGRQPVSFVLLRPQLVGFSRCRPDFACSSGSASPLGILSSILQQMLLAVRPGRQRRLCRFLMSTSRPQVLFQRSQACGTQGPKICVQPKRTRPCPCSCVRHGAC